MTEEEFFERTGATPDTILTITLKFSEIFEEHKCTITTAMACALEVYWQAIGDMAKAGATHDQVIEQCEHFHQITLRRAKSEIAKHRKGKNT